MTNPTNNPLDCIRSLAPADMTDDELGVAVYLAIGYPTQEHLNESGGGRAVFYIMRKPDHSNHWSEPGISIQRDGVYWDHQFDRPQSSYDALLPIVREWVNSHRNRFAAMQALKRTKPFLIRKRGSHWVIVLDINYEPRQLAEAFVTAARSVPNGH